MKRLLLLGAPVFQKPVVKKAKKHGFYVGVVDISPNAPAVEAADVYFQGSIRDYDAMLEVAKGFKPDAILSGACDTSVVTVARLCEELGLPGTPLSVAKRATDKVLMLEAFKMAGVAHPSWQVIRKEDIYTAKAAMPYPVVTKPTDSAGGRGINLVQNNAEFRKALIGSSSAGISGDVLVEEYLKGNEVSIEVLIDSGVPHAVQVTDKLTSGAPHFYETGHVQPTQLAKEDRDAASELACDAVRAVGLINSAAHVEVMITDEGPKMVELGARVGGDWITSYLIDNSVVGIDMVETMFEMALGNHCDSWRYQDSGVCAATKFIPASKGMVLSVSGIEQALACDGVVHVEPTAEIGRTYDDAEDDSSRFASVVATGKTQQEALEVCDLALSKLKIIVR